MSRDFSHKANSHLKPCPFCSNEAHVYHSTGDEAMDQRWYIACTKCGVKTPTEYGSNTWQSGSEARKRDLMALTTVLAIWNIRT